MCRLKGLGGTTRRLAGGTGNGLWIIRRSAEWGISPGESGQPTAVTSLQDLTLRSNA